MERKSGSRSIRKTDLKKIGVASFLLLLTAAAVEGRNDDEQIFAYFGQRLELYCKREKDCDVSKISWLKDGHILHRLCFKEDSDVGLVLNESFVTLVIPKVKESDAGVYQCGSPGICFINLTVLQIPPTTSPTTSAESSDDKCNSTLENILYGIYSLQLDVKGYYSDIRGFSWFNSIILILITLFIGAGMIKIFQIKKWWKGKYEQLQTNAEAPLIDYELKTMLNDQLKPLVDDMKGALCKSEDIITGMVKLNDGMGNELTKVDVALLDDMLRKMKECTMRFEEFENFMRSVGSQINRLEGDFYTHQDIVVSEFRRQDKEIKDLKEMVSQISGEHGNQVCVSDIEPHSEG